MRPLRRGARPTKPPPDNAVPRYNIHSVFQRDGYPRNWHFRAPSRELAPRPSARQQQEAAPAHVKLAPSAIATQAQRVRGNDNPAMTLSPLTVCRISVRYPRNPSCPLVSARVRSSMQTRFPARLDTRAADFRSERLRNDRDPGAGADAYGPEAIHSGGCK